MFDKNDDSRNRVRYFGKEGRVVYGDVVRVFLHGFLIYEFSADDVYSRNVAAVSLSKEKKFKKGELAAAFDLSRGRFRQLRLIAKREGIESLPSRRRGGSESKVTESSRKLLFRAFDRGMGVSEAHKKYGEKTKLSPRTIRRVRAKWKENQACVGANQGKTAANTVFNSKSKQQELPPPVGVPVPTTVDDGVDYDDEPIVDVQIASRKNVRNVGSLLMVAVLFSLGLHEAIVSGWKAGTDWRNRLRVAIDGFITALCIGEKCVEGVRRLEHSSASTLLRTTTPPSANWTRRIFYRYLKDEGSIKAHLRMTENYLAKHRIEDAAPAVFYLDGHMRPYTGKRKLQKGWRMQDKRVREGTHDYYLHDEDGRPLFRVDVPMHGTLGVWMKPITEMLRKYLGSEQRILVAFDRGGAFPKHLSSLCERGFEFVTYERGPYPEIPVEMFSQTLELEDETLGVYEEKAELGEQKVNVRRIALRTQDDRQVNVIAASQEPRERLVEIITGRWVQENSFKHGNERWGTNHLDGRKPKKYPKNHVIFNPARSRLERAITVLREREGTLRRKLARLKKGSSKYAELKKEIKDIVADQNRLVDERKSTNKYELLSKTDLADRLVRMDTNYKTLMDTIRIACINGEEELAGSLRPFLQRPDEAKKVLKNVFSAPGSILVDDEKIVVAIDMVGNTGEKSAVKALFNRINETGFKLPGDVKSRPLIFKSLI